MRKCCCGVVCCWLCESSVYERLHFVTSGLTATTYDCQSCNDNPTPVSSQLSGTVGDLDVYLTIEGPLRTGLASDSCRWSYEGPADFQITQYDGLECVGVSHLADKIRVTATRTVFPAGGYLAHYPNPDPPISPGYQGLYPCVMSYWYVEIRLFNSSTGYSFIVAQFFPPEYASILAMWEAGTPITKDDIPASMSANCDQENDAAETYNTLLLPTTSLHDCISFAAGATATLEFDHESPVCTPPIGCLWEYTQTYDCDTGWGEPELVAPTFLSGAVDYGIAHECNNLSGYRQSTSWIKIGDTPCKYSWTNLGPKPDGCECNSDCSTWHLDGTEDTSELIVNYDPSPPTGRSGAAPYDCVGCAAKCFFEWRQDYACEGGFGSVVQYAKSCTTPSPYGDVFDEWVKIAEDEDGCTYKYVSVGDSCDVDGDCDWPADPTAQTGTPDDCDVCGETPAPCSCPESGLASSYAVSGGPVTSAPAADGSEFNPISSCFPAATGSTTAWDQIFYDNMFGASPGTCDWESSDSEQEWDGYITAGVGSILLVDAGGGDCYWQLRMTMDSPDVGQIAWVGRKAVGSSPAGTYTAINVCMSPGTLTIA